MPVFPNPFGSKTSEWKERDVSNDCSLVTHHHRKANVRQNASMDSVQYECKPDQLTM